MRESGDASSLRALLVAWGPAVAWAACILWGSGEQLSGPRTGSWVAVVLQALGLADPGRLVPIVNLALRKLGHLVEYGILGVLLWRALRMTRPLWSGRRLWWLLVSMAVSCAFLDELRQASAVNRTGSAADVLVDAVGAFLGVLVVYGRHRKGAKVRGVPLASGTNCLDRSERP